ncbi:MAG: hypothetical protein EP332_07750 [Bacteroidetes bacterium]|nr:MAG: hypothetical protein EP332_07750 [Bacteroidota bacterium]
MNSIRHFVCFILFFIGLNTLNAQNFYPKKLANFNVGFGRTAIKYNHSSLSRPSVNINHVPFSYEYFSRIIYFHTDVLTPMVDLGLGGLDRQFWWGHERDGYVYNGGDWPLARLGIGTYLGKHLGVYGGAQWGYSRWRVARGRYKDGKLEYSINEETEVGGHTFGPGIHLVVDYPKVLVRGSVMYDFVTRGFSGPRYTNALGLDVLVLYKVSRSGRFGLFANLQSSNGRGDIGLSKFRFGLALCFGR